MSQTFTLKIADDSLALKAHELGVNTDELQQIDIKVTVSWLAQPEPQLVLHYRVKLPSSILAAQLDWPVWDPIQVQFTDYLWQSTCLECFIAKSYVENSAEIDSAIDSIAEQKNQYIEINASPSGRFALYHFSDYRTPNTLPPSALLQLATDQLAYINWNPVLSPKQPSTLAMPSYERCFGLPLDQLPFNLFTKKQINAQINPCVILKFGEVILYFAPRHAAPPDFHHRRYWSYLKRP